MINLNLAESVHKSAHVKLTVYLLSEPSRICPVSVNLLAPRAGLFLVKLQSKPSPESHPLDWLFRTKTGLLPDRVLARLIQAEAHEGNPHFKDDYRQTFIALSTSLRGELSGWDALVSASYAMYGVHPDKLHAKVLARREALLGPAGEAAPIQKRSLSGVKVQSIEERKRA